MATSPATDRYGTRSAVFGDETPLIHYVKCLRPMPAEAERIRRLITKHQAAYIVCDSVAFACDGPPETAEAAQRYFQSVRRFGIGSLHIAHTTKAEDSDQKPFGSVFWHNGARATWNIKLSNESSPSLLSLGLYNRKSNLGPRLPAVGLDVTFTGDRTLINRANVADMPDLVSSLPIWQRMKQRLDGSKPMAMHALAEEIGASVEAVEKALQRKRNLFTRVSGSDRITRIALVSNRDEQR